MANIRLLRLLRLLWPAHNTASSEAGRSPLKMTRTCSILACSVVQLMPAFVAMADALCDLHIQHSLDFSEFPGLFRLTHGCNVQSNVHQNVR